VLVRALEGPRPTHEPGAYPAYHGFTYGWLVGEVIGAPAEARARAAELSPPMKRLLQIERMRGPARALRTVSRSVGFPIDLAFLRGALIVKQGGEIFWHPNVLAAPISAANGPSPHARSRGSMPRSPTAERSTVSACFRKRRAPRPR